MARKNEWSCNEIRQRTSKRKGERQRVDQSESFSRGHWQDGFTTSVHKWNERAFFDIVEQNPDYRQDYIDYPYVNRAIIFLREAIPCVTWFILIRIEKMYQNLLSLIFKEKKQKSFARNGFLIF